VLELVDEHGKLLDQGKGFLTIAKPWPGMLRTLYKDDERFKQNYWSQYPGRYFTGDTAVRDADGYIWVLGRNDDVIKVSGHRISGVEIESALVAHKSVAEAAVVGAAHQIKGEGIHAFVTLKATVQPSDTVAQELSDWIVKEIGSLARPERIHFVTALPKTRSGKIMRRLMREIVTTHKVAGDTSTLEDYGVVVQLSQQGKDEEEILREQAAGEKKE